jgi:hypothetical protein
MKIRIQTQKDFFRKYFSAADKSHNAAVVRTLNILYDRALSQTSKKIAKKISSSVGSIKKKIKVIRATVKTHFFSWEVSGEGLPLIRPRKVKRGVSSVFDDKRIKHVDKINGGSRPFLIPTSRSSKKGPKLAVYRKEGSVRKVTKFTYGSLSELLEKNWEDDVLEYLPDNFKTEYQKQLKSAYRKR